jgi:hypothetical protein
MNDVSGDVVSRFAALLSSLGSNGSPAARLCEAGQMLLDADGAAITTTLDPSARQVWVSTDDLAEIIEDAEEVAGEGPGLDAERTGEVVQGVIGLNVPARWPFLEDRLVRAGFSGSIVAVPLVGDQGGPGVLLAYRWLRKIDSDPSVLTFLSRTLGRLLFHDPDERDLGESWPVRSEIHQATGMVVAQLEITTTEALAVLRARAYAESISLDVVAADIVSRRVRFNDISMEGD